MPVWRLQSEFAADTTLPRDYVVITPHFNDQGVGTDPQQLCDDLADAYVTYITQGPTREIKVTAYDAQGTPPVFPQGQAVRGAGVSPPSGVAREVALCLSYYSERNLPRQRGRLYIPAFMVTQAGNVIARPDLTLMNKIGALAAVFEGLGGVDVDWSVFSRTTQTAHPITNWWVDNEWDTVRSRGLRADTRVQGTTSEA